MFKDFTPTSEQISLHGLGFIQVKLPANKRLHVWHPDLPRRSCYRYSAIHNHRFSFTSTVLIGQQKNQRYHMVVNNVGTHDLISHDGPRSDKGGRVSFFCGRVDMVPKTDAVEIYGPGETYFMDALEFHETPNDGIIVTIMQKHTEGLIHANSAILTERVFDQTFDRFQYGPEKLWQFVTDALQIGGAV